MTLPVTIQITRAPLLLEGHRSPPFSKWELGEFAVRFGPSPVPPIQTKSYNDADRDTIN